MGKDWWHYIGLVGLSDGLAYCLTPLFPTTQPRAIPQPDVKVSLTLCQTLRLQFASALFTKKKTLALPSVPVLWSNVKRRVTKHVTVLALLNVLHTKLHLFNISYILVRKYKRLTSLTISLNYIKRSIFKMSCVFILQNHYYNSLISTLLCQVDSL